MPHAAPNLLADGIVIDHGHPGGPSLIVDALYSKARYRPFTRVMSEGMSHYEIYYVLATDEEIQRLNELSTAAVH
jgi:hypothetical protein